MTALIIILAYVITVSYNYWWITEAYYNKHGLWYRSKPKNIDVFFCFFPFVNLSVFFSGVFGESPYKRKPSNKPPLAERIFKPKAK